MISLQGQFFILWISGKEGNVYEFQFTSRFEHKWTQNESKSMFKTSLFFL